MSTAGKFLASWQCPICGKKRKVSMQNECCDFPSRYEEIEIEHAGIVGHVDAVFKDSKGFFWILDFKTCSMKGSLTKLEKPGIAYVEQVESYALMLWLQYQIRVKGVVLMFVKRDNPAEPVIWFHELKALDFRAIDERMKEYKRRHKEVLAINDLDDALALSKYGRCKNPYCGTCKKDVPLKKQLLIAYKIGKQKNFLPIKDLK
jgi:hypothetical protein